jgi:hypothetical protein
MRSSWLSDPASTDLPENGRPHMAISTGCTTRSLPGPAGQPVDEDVDEQLEALVIIGERELVGQAGHVREDVARECEATGSAPSA